MRMCQNRGPCYRTILLTITTSACISIVIFFILQFSSERVNTMKRELSIENSFHSEKLTDERCIPVCTSRSCIKQADMLLRSMNPSNEPCENFFKFLCGTYEEKTGSSENSSILVDMTTSFMNKLKNIIENIEADPGSGPEKLKIMYESCVNLGSSEVRGFEHFSQFLDKVEIHNWPYLPSDFKFSEFGLSKLLAVFRATSNIGYFQFNVVSMDEVGEDEMNEKFVKIMVMEAGLNATPPVQRDAAMDILSYFAIESEEIEILLNDYEDVRNALIRFHEEFKTNYDICEDCSDIWIDCSTVGNDAWAYVCEAVKIYLNVTNLKSSLSKNEIAIPIYFVEYAKNLIPRLKSLPDRSVANYFALDVLWNHLDEVSFFFRRKSQKYFSYLKHEWKKHIPKSNRWEYCVSWIINKMQIVLENELVKNYLTKSRIEEVHNIHQGISSAISKMISAQKWLPKMSKLLMKKHIESLECNMVSLQQLLPNDTYVNELLKWFNPTRDNFFQNALDYVTGQMITDTALHEEMDNIHRFHPEFQVGANTLEDTQIALHYGLFMPPLYYPDDQKLDNMIQLTPVIGHEIGHVINMIIRMISESVNVTKEVFSQKKSCIEDQFGNFKFPILDENLNGTQFYDENLSDNLAYAVADKMIDEMSSSDDAFLLPGLPYTTKQILYMSSRQVFCVKVTREMEIFLKENDKHPPLQYRIIGSTQNSNGYSEAFDCPEGSYMNPENKCSLLDSS